MRTGRDAAYTAEQQKIGELAQNGGFCQNFTGGICIM